MLMSSVLRLSMVSLIPLLTELLSSQLEKRHNRGRKQGSKDKAPFKRTRIICTTLSPLVLARKVNVYHHQGKGTRDTAPPDPAEMCLQSQSSGKSGMKG